MLALALALAIGMPSSSTAQNGRVEAPPAAGSVVGLEANARGKLVLLSRRRNRLRLSVASPGRSFGTATPIGRSEVLAPTYAEGYALSVSPSGGAAAAWVGWDRTDSGVDSDLGSDLSCCDQIRSTVIAPGLSAPIGRGLSARGDNADEAFPMAAALPMGGHVVAWSGDGGAEYTLLDAMGRSTGRLPIARDARYLVGVGAPADGTVGFTYAVPAERGNGVTIRSALRLPNGQVTAPRTVLSERELDDCCSLEGDDSLVSVFDGAGNETAALVARKGPRTRLVATNRALRGRFDKPQLLDACCTTSGGISVGDLEINERGGGVLVWHVEYPNGAVAVRYAVRRRRGRFGRATTLIAPPKGSGAPAVSVVDAAVSPRRVAIAYKIYGERRPSETYVRSGSLTEPLGPPRLISSESDVEGPFVALDGRDRLAVAWTDGQGTKVLRLDP